MRGLIRRVAAILLVGVACAPATAAFGRYPAWLVAQQGVMNQDEAAARVRELTGGRVLDIRSRNVSGRPVYHVKVLLADGRVRVLTIDAASGRAAGGDHADPADRR